MAEIHSDNSGSDISTSSWTVLEAAEEKADQSSDTSDGIVKIELENIEDLPQEETRRKDDSFLTFDEYLQERLLEYDYQHEEKPEKLKKLYKKKLRREFRNTRAQTMGISILVTILVAVSAFATLCSTLSQPVVNKGVDDVKNSTNFTEILHQINETSKATKLLSKINVTFPENQTRKLPEPILEPKLEKYDTCELPPSNKYTLIYPDAKIKKIKPKVVKSNWATLKETVMNATVIETVSIVASTLTIITIFLEIRVRSALQKKKKNRKCQAKIVSLRDLEAKVTRLLFRELPFWQCEHISRKEAAAAPLKQAQSIAVVRDRKSPIDNILFKKYRFSEHCLAPVVCVLKKREAGKSECQLRFEDLDDHQVKFENLKQMQRNKIRLLKQKYRNQVSSIKDNEEEPEARADKINKTSQMFIRKLKYNREKYLMELRKLRELRQKVAEEKKKEPDRSYPVSLPSCNFGERFKMIKEKFERENNQIPKEFNFQQ